MSPHVLILGAGPAGLGAAFDLSRRGSAQVTVLEAGNQVGGYAGSFDLAGVQVDYGSHRLHPACDPQVLDDIRGLLGDDLLKRPRHGRIRLQDRWIHFPLKPFDLLLKSHPRFTIGLARDLAGKSFQRKRNSQCAQTFASVLENGLGKTVCSGFYFPYSRKIWGLASEDISATEAYRRVSANSPLAILQRLLPAARSRERKSKGYFSYPRHGFGQISQAYLRSASQQGVHFILNARIQQVEIEQGRPHVVRFESGGQNFAISADQVWSTIPITTLAELLHPVLEPEYLASAASIRYRAMILIYLVLDQGRFSGYDAHYFPEPGIPISRLSEPKNYSSGEGPLDTTVLCAELPCSPDGLEWKMPDESLRDIVCGSLEGAGIPIQVPVRQTVIRRLYHAYPIYRQGYEVPLGNLDHRLSQIERLVTFGRQGLFAHDNIHHALSMGYSAAKCLKPDGLFDDEQWQSFRQIFRTHVVED